MNKNDISILIHYNFWANERILAACKNLTFEEFSREITPNPGWGSLRGLLVHILDSEFGWRSVLQAQDADNILEASEFPDVATLVDRWDLEKVAWIDFVNSLSDERLTMGNDVNSQEGPMVWQTILHVVIHGMQHRGEAAFILTGYGYSPGEIDFGIFLKQDPAVTLG